MRRPTSWSPSRLSDYEECALRWSLTHWKSLCPTCHRGEVVGEYDKPHKCTSCGVVMATPAPLARGSRIGRSLERYVRGEVDALDQEAARHPDVLAIAVLLRDEFRRGLVDVERSVVLGRDWHPASTFDRAKAWLRVKLDVLRGRPKHAAVVIDWKTGGIDKKTGEVRASEKYDDQLELYGLAALSEDPTLVQARAALVFTDTWPRHDPVVERAPVKRSQLVKLRKKWEPRAERFLTDEVLAPRPGYYCAWCPHQKAKGGPCPY